MNRIKYDGRRYNYIAIMKKDNSHECLYMTYHYESLYKYMNNHNIDLNNIIFYHLFNEQERFRKARF